MARVCSPLVVALTFAASTAVGAEFSGELGHVRDGDTFAVCDETLCTMIRLCGVDAPERDAPGGPAAKVAVTQLLTGKALRCVQVGDGTPCDGRSRPTNGDRVVAQCFADGIDVAQWLVDQQMACDWVRFSGGHYSAGGGERC